MSNKKSKAINEDYELVDGDGGPFSGFDKVKFETWLRVGFEGYCLENKGAWAFPGAEAAIARQDYLALGLRDAYHELDAEGRAHFRHAVANVIASLEAKESNVPIIEHPRLKYFDPHNEHAPLDTWLFGACVGGKSPLLGRDETKEGHIYFYRPQNPSVRVRLPEVDKGLGDFIALLRDAMYEEGQIPIPLSMSMASPEKSNEPALAFVIAITRPREWRGVRGKAYDSQQTSSFREAS